MGGGGAPIDTWTVMFTDLVGSTSLRVAVGEDAFDGLRTAHDRAVRQELDRHSARFVKALGDGFMAGFTSTSACVGAAISIQQAIDEQNLAGGPALAVRIGISVGDALIEEADLQGRAVVEASRLCGAAAGGEILCSDAVRAVAANRGGTQFTDPRACELKGFPDPIQACTVVWEPRPYDIARRGLTFSVLGPLAVFDNAGPIAIGGPKERQVLAHLLARANAVVLVDTLVDALWADRPPRTAERTVHAYVARLRGALEPGRPRGAASDLLLTEGRGYRLRVNPDQCDSLRFEEMARAGSEQLERGDLEATTTLRDALALWRGAAFAGFSDVDACATEARRLDELRLAAIEDRVDGDLAAGRAKDVVAELDALATEHPFRERVWAQLMLALYRTGRQRDALAAYQRARAVLVEELGIEPGPELRDLEAAILSQDPSLDVRRRGDLQADAPSSLPLPLQIVGPGFVGRERALDRLRTAWTHATEGRGGLVSIVGPEGIGKTRLVAELARIAHDEGGVVLYGRCDHAHAGQRALLDLALRSGGVSLGSVDDGTSDDLAASVARFLPAWSDGRPVLFVLDDLHLAAGDALELVAQLAEWCVAGPVLVVGAFRADADPSGGDDSSAHVVLGGLDAAAVAQICETYAADGWMADEIDQLRELTAGVPLLVHEHASEWARQRVVRRVEDAADRVTGARVRLASSRDDIADSVESIQRLLEQRRAHLATRQAQLTSTVAGFEPCPYKGLARFEEADAASFFGRERLVADLVARVPGSRLLAIVGPSGSGKSSLVRAGLLPALAQGVLPGTDRWQLLTMCPGTHPARELERLLQRDPNGAERRLVFADQFEEAFTLCSDEDERVRFFDRLCEFADSGALVVLAVRADHLGPCAAHAGLADLIEGNDVLVGPMRDSELRRVVELPAQRSGLALETGLADVIVADVAGRAGALPLLSTALAETWERRSNQTLTLTGYRAAGGVNGALARMAEDAYQSLPPGPRAGARRVLLRLCDAGDDGTLDLRRRLPLGEAASASDADERGALESLIDHRLLTIDGEAVEVAHEALLREWPRLRAWLDDDVQGRKLHRRLAETTRAWLVAGEDPSELYRGTRLDAALEWATGNERDLSEAERRFLTAARDLTDAETRAVEERARRETRANRRLRVLLVGVAVFAAIALIAGVLAQGAADRADIAANAAEARRVGAQALVTDDPDLALLLAVEANQLDDSADTRSNLVAALSRSPQLMATARNDQPLLTVAVSPKGDVVATGDPFAGISFYDARTLDLVGQIDEPPWKLRFSPDGNHLAVAANNFDPGSGNLRDPVPVLLIDPTSRETEEAQLEGQPFGAFPFDVTFSADGQFLAASFEDEDGGFASIMVWNLDDRAKPVRRIAPDGDLGPALALSPDGSIVFAGSTTPPSVTSYDVATGELIATTQLSTEAIALDPTGSELAVADGNDVALLDSITLGEVGRLQGHEAPVNQVRFSVDGKRVVSASKDRLAIVWDLESRTPIDQLRGHAGAVTDAGFSPDASVLYTSSLDRRLLAWDLRGDERFIPRSTIAKPSAPAPWADVSPSGRDVAFVDLEGTADGGAFIQFLDTDTGTLGELIDTGHQRFGESTWNPIDSRQFATTGADGVVRLWDAGTGRIVKERKLIDGHIGALDFSRDGRRIAFGMNTTDVAVMDAQTLEPIGPSVAVAGGLLWVHSSPDGHDAVGLTSSTVVLIDLDEGRVTHEIDAEFDPWQGEYSPDGKRVAVASLTGEVVLIDAVTGTFIGERVVGHKDGVETVSFSPDGTMFVTGGRDGRVGLFDGRTNRLLASVLPGPANTPAYAEFLGDGTVAIVGRDGAVYRWDISPAHWVDTACRIAGRNFTQDEWRAAFGSRPYRETCPGY